MSSSRFNPFRMLHLNDIEKMNSGEDLGRQSKDKDDMERKKDDAQVLINSGSIFMSDLLSLESECQLLIQKTSKISTLKKNFLEAESLMSWLRDWKMRRKEDKLITSYDELLPKVARCEENLKIWLEAVTTRKWKTFHDSIEMLNKIDEYFNEMEIRSDSYDEVLNEARVIYASLDKESTKLKVMLECLEVS